MADNVWVAKNDVIIQRFMQTPFWTKLLALPDLMYIMVGGSYFYGDMYKDAGSDYDIFVVTNTIGRISPARFIKIDGQVLHWAVVPFNIYFPSFLSQQDPDRILATHAGIVKFNHFDRNLLLYENPKYTSVIDKLISLCNTLQAIHFYEWVKKLDETVNYRGPYNRVEDLYKRPKAFYHIFAAYRDMTSQGDLGWIRNLKQKLNQKLDLTAEEILKVRDTFIEVVQWCREHEFNVRDVELKLYNNFFDGNQNLIL